MSDKRAMPAAPSAPRLDPAAAARQRAPLSLQIDRLALHGLPLSRREGEHLQRALETELGRLLGNGGLGAKFGGAASLASLSLGPVQLPPGRDPRALGRALAQALYRGIGHEA